MNALATDQAERLAKMIWQNPNLRAVTAGLSWAGANGPPPVMGPKKVITDKETQRLSPPDILLTNYKMLDYLLVRPRDVRLWRQNEPETLAATWWWTSCTPLMARRARTWPASSAASKRVKTPPEHLCCVGTSATLGSEGEGGELRKYAQKVFGEPFDEEAIVGESRLSAGEFLGDSLISRVELPSPAKILELDPETYEGYRGFLRAQHRLWFDQEISMLTG